MILYGEFINRNDEEISVVIYNIDKTGTDIYINTSPNIRFAGEDPVVITSDLSDSFSTIIKTSCKIRLQSKIWLSDYLYANNYESVVVNVFRGNECIFAGFVTPNVFNMDYSNEWNTIEINCTDKLSVLDNKYLSDGDLDKYNNLKNNATTRTFKYLIQQLNIADNKYVINNLPSNTQNTMMWVETGYERLVDDATGEVNYYAVETNVKELDANNAVTTVMTRLSDTPITPTYIQSEDTMVDTDGQLYYKKYAWVQVNGENQMTSDFIKGDPAPMPYVVDTINVLDGWSYGPMPQPFEYYEHFRIDNVMSDGAVKEGENDTIGNRILESPVYTPLGSTWELREAGDDDLDQDETTGNYYYKDYAWVMMVIDNVNREWKTGDWQRGRQYIPSQQINS